MEHLNTSRCQCEDAFHLGEECTHTAMSLLPTGGEPIALCACCAHHKHMTPQRTAVPDAEREVCADR